MTLSIPPTVPCSDALSLATDASTTRSIRLPAYSSAWNVPASWNSRQGENHCCLQSSLPLYPPYRRTAHMRKVTEKDCRLLASSYRSCLEIATDRHLKCIAFCCISKGEFHFPSKRAAEIAIQTVQDFIKQNKNSLEVIFNVFKDNDFGIYKRLLQ